MDDGSQELQSFITCYNFGFIHFIYLLTSTFCHSYQKKYPMEVEGRMESKKPEN